MPRTRAPKPASPGCESSYATRKIRAGEEIFIDYGDDFWDNMKPRGQMSAEAKVSTPTSPTSQTTTSSSSLWAASAHLPEPTPEWYSPTKANNHVRSTEASTLGKFWLSNCRGDRVSFLGRLPSHGDDLLSVGPRWRRRAGTHEVATRVGK